MRTSKDKAFYRQLYEQIRDAILRGELPAGQRLPSKRAFAESSGHSVNTVTAAYQQLADEGFVEARPRSGFYVQALPLPLGDGQPVPSLPEPGSETAADELAGIDFRSSHIEERAFPFRTFRKLSRELWFSGTPELLREPPAKGWLSLRREIAIYLASNRGLAANPENILIQAQSSSLLNILLDLLSPETRIALEDPGFQSFYEIARKSGHPLSLLPVGSEGIRPRDIPAQGPLLLSVSPTHQYPSGAVMPASRRGELLSAVAAGPERWVLEDDYDSEFRYEGQPLPSLKSLDSGDRVIYLGNFSKSICPGLRVSYMVLPAELRQRFEAAEEHYNCPVPSPIQLLLARFLAEGHYARQLRRLRGVYREKRGRMLSWLRKNAPDWEIMGAEAGFHLNVRLPRPLPKEALRDVLKKEGIRLTFLSDLRIGAKKNGVPEDAARPILLLSFSALSTEDAEAGLKIILAAVRKLEGSAV